MIHDLKGYKYSLPSMIITVGTGSHPRYCNCYAPIGFAFGDLVCGDQDSCSCKDDMTLHNDYI